jgi:hypothetical protein
VGDHTSHLLIRSPCGPSCHQQVPLLSPLNQRMVKLPKNGEAADEAETERLQHEG